MQKSNTFWDSFTGPYQMGEQKHRLYLLGVLEEFGVKSIFDNGCGTGPIYEIIKNRKLPFKYKGADFAPGMIKICKDLFPEGDFEVQDARKLKEKDDSWDCVLLLHCLDHVDDYKAVISEAARVSEKYVCIVLWRGLLDSGTKLYDRNMINKKEGEKPWSDTYLHEFSKETLYKEFEKNNLKIVHDAWGSAISDEGKFNYLVLLEKGGVK